MFRTFASALFTSAAFAGLADYTENGANWPDLCKYGKEQSPIDLTEAAATKNGVMEITGFNYYDFAADENFDVTKDATYTTNFTNENLRQ